MSLIEIGEFANKVIGFDFMWSKSVSGYYEEVPALDSCSSILGMNISIVEQDKNELYMIEGGVWRNEYLAKADVWESVDLSELARKIFKELGFYVVEEVS